MDLKSAKVEREFIMYIYILYIYKNMAIVVTMKAYKWYRTSS